MLTANTQPWTGAAAPGIKCAPLPPMVFRALERACQAVDSDIEKFGKVTYETVEQVRNSLALARAWEQA
jgi:hypothetical protein